MSQSKNVFDTSVGKVMKALISSEKTYNDMAEKINDKLKELLSKEELDKTLLCTATKLSRYVRGESSLPIIYLAALLDYKKKAADDFFGDTYNIRGQIWHGNESKLPQNFSLIYVDDDENRDKLEKDYYNCLEKLAIESKFAFWGYRVTKKYIETMESDEYPLTNETAALIESHVDDIIESLLKSDKPPRIISLGIGNGKKDEIIISKLLNTLIKQKKDTIVEYWILDISSDMIKEGRYNVLQKLENKFPKEDIRKRLNITSYQTDFFSNIDKLCGENTKNRQNLYLLLGNTLGNFPEAMLLTRLNGVLNNGDLLLIDNQLIIENDIEDIKNNGRLSEISEKSMLSMYNNPTYTTYVNAILDRASIVPGEETSDEKDRKDGIYNPIINYNPDVTIGLLKGPENCISVDLDFTFAKDKVIIRGDTKKQILIPKDSILKVKYSKKYAKSALCKLIKSYFQLLPENVYISENNQYALILSKKIKKSDYDE